VMPVIKARFEDVLTSHSPGNGWAYRLGQREDTRSHRESQRRARSRPPAGRPGRPPRAPPSGRFPAEAQPENQRRWPCLAVSETGFVDDGVELVHGTTSGEFDAGDLRRSMCRRRRTSKTHGASGRSCETCR